MFGSRNAPQVGAPAPIFTLPAHDGRQVALAEFRGRSRVVLAFYPMDDTPG